MQREQLNITNPAAARALIDNRSVQLLTPFMKRPQSLSEAALELSVKLPKLSYHVKRFIELGLLEVACTERRLGRAIKLYQSSARTFYIPFNLTPSETLEQLITEIISPGTQRFQRELSRTMQKLAPDWVFYLTCNEENIVSLSLKPDGHYLEPGRTFSDGLLEFDEPVLVANEGRLQLDFAAAKAFQRELFELYARYLTKQSDKGQSYAFRLGLIPMQDDRFE